jgi:hypothetical protein
MRRKRRRNIAHAESHQAHPGCPCPDFKKRLRGALGRTTTPTVLVPCKVLMSKHSMRGRLPAPARSATRPLIGRRLVSAAHSACCRRRYSAALVCASSNKWRLFPRCGERNSTLAPRPPATILAQQRHRAWPHQNQRRDKDHIVVELLDKCADGEAGLIAVGSSGGGAQAPPSSHFC